VLLIGGACSSGHAHKLTAAGHTSSSTVDTATTVDQATSPTGAASPSPTTATTRALLAQQPRSTASAAPTAPPPTANNNSVTVTEADDGQTFTLHRNQALSVSLSNDNVWSEPQASSTQVLTRTSGSANGDGSAQATFAATGDGQTAVSADGRSHPQPCETANPPCMVPDHIVHFQVTVNVVG
jgi:hypothetical protein